MRYLALDIGDKTIGTAVSDPLNLTAQGIATIIRKSNKEDFKQLGEIISEYEIGTFVVGLPKNMNGTEGERCEIVRSFAKKLSGKFPAQKLIFQDERLSTVAAERTLLEADLSRKKRKKVIDKMAAVYILQGFLDTLKRSDFKMAKETHNHAEEVIDEDFYIEMTDEEGNKYFYIEEMVIPVGDDRYALLIEVDEDGDVVHTHGENCDCGEDDENVIVAKIVLNEDGEEEYIEPTDEEYEAVQDAYEKIMDEEE